MAKKKKSTAILSTGEAVIAGFLIVLASIGAIACFILGGIAFFNGRDGTAGQPPAASAQGTLPSNAPTKGPTAETAEPVESDSSIKSGQYTLPSGFSINFSNSVRNDVTGNWRLSTTADSFVPAEYAIEYYRTMFSSDNEIHAIWNATLGTMTRVTVMSGIVFADTLEYVEGEEHDAKLLFSGMLLDSKMFSVETGEEILE